MPSADAASLAPYTVRTRNFRANSENRIHSDDVARQYGFAGALVPGVAVYAHMVHPLVERFGEPWLSRAEATVRLFKPAYDGDELTIAPAPATGEPDAVELACRNQAGVTLAQVISQLPPTPPVPNPLHARPPAGPGEREPITWDVVVPDQPLRAFHWRPTLAEALTWCDDTQDTSAIFREGATPPLHPGMTLQAANRVFSEHFVLGPWVHVSSRVAHHGLLRAGDAVEVRAVPLRKWEHKGHHFMELYVAMLNGGVLAQEVYHEAIFQMRPRDAA